MIKNTLFFTILILSSSSWAVAPQMQPEACDDMRSSGLEQLGDTSEMIVKARERLGVNNNLIEAQEPVAQSLLRFGNTDGGGVGVQLCEGLALTAKHVVFEDSFGPNMKERNYLSPFPLQRSTLNFFDSNNLVGDEVRYDRQEGEGIGVTNDYVFIKTQENTDGVQRASSNNNTYPIPVLFTEEDFSQNKPYTPPSDVYVYRGNKETHDATIRYATVMRSERPCGIRTIGPRYKFNHDCPTQGGTSGAPLIAPTGGPSFMVAVHNGGDRDIDDSGYVNRTTIFNEEMCRVYENHCGRPCATTQEWKEAVQTQSSI